MKFNNMWECTPNKPLETPVISDYICDYVTLRPLAKDEKGNVINDTRFDIQKAESKVKLSEYVESFRDECDVYKILECCARSGDYSVLLNDKEYGDCTPFKDNRPENDETLKNLQKGYTSLNSEVKSALLDGKSDEEILEIIKKLNSKNNDSASGTVESGDDNA